MGNIFSGMRKIQLNYSVRVINRKLVFIKQALLNLGVLLLALFIIFFVWSEVNDTQFILQPFQVPAKFSNNGYSGTEVSNILIDKTLEIEQTAQAARNLKEFNFSDIQQEFEVEVLGVGISLGAVRKAIKNLFGLQQKRISGSIKTNDDLVILSLRITNFPVQTYRAKVDSVTTYFDALDNVIQQAAEKIVEVQDPLLLAYFKGRKGNYNECTELLMYVIKTLPKDRSFAYNVWGIVLRRQGKIQEALEKYQLSIKENKSYHSPYTNIGNIYRDSADELNSQELRNPLFKKAIEMYRKALAHSPNNANAYNNLGYTYELLGDYDKAISYAQKSVAIDSKFGLGYSTLAEAYGLKSDTIKFYHFADLALKYGYNVSAQLDNEPYTTFKSDSTFLKILTRYK